MRRKSFMAPASALVGPWGSGETALQRALAQVSRGERLIRVCASGESTIGDAGALRLAIAIDEHPEDVRSLQLRGHAVSDAGAERLAMALARHRLHTLDLGANAVGDAAILKLADALQASELRVLGLEGNRIGDAASAALARLLEQQPALEELQLAGNRLTAVGADNLARPLASHRALRLLLLDRNPLGDLGALSLAAVLQLGGSLWLLGLAETAVGDGGAEALAAGLARHQDLRELLLGGNGIGSAGVAALASVLGQHRGLRMLGLDRNFCDDDAALQLVLTLSHMDREGLVCDLTGNPVSRFDGSALADLMLSAKTVRSLASRGVLLEQLLTFYRELANSGQVDDTTSTAEVVSRFVLPETAAYGMSYAEFLHSAPAAVYVIHPWAGAFRDLVQAVAAHATGQTMPNLDPSHEVYSRFPHALGTCYFVDVFAIYQNEHSRIGETRCQRDKMDMVLSHLQGRGGKALLVVDREYQTLTRLWCLWEAHWALRHGLPTDVEFGLVRPRPRRRPQASLAAAEASRPDERALLLAEVEIRGAGARFFDVEVTNRLEAAVATRYRAVSDRLAPAAREELEWAELQDAAVEALRTALEAQSPAMLRSAIEAAISAKLDANAVVAAKRQLATWLPAVAAPGNDAVALAHAIATAEEGAGDDASIQAARCKLESLQDEPG